MSFERPRGRTPRSRSRAPREGVLIIALLGILLMLAPVLARIKGADADWQSVGVVKKQAFNGKLGDVPTGGPYELHTDTYIITARHRPDVELQRAGHASMVETQAGETYLAYLCGRPLR